MTPDYTVVKISMLTQDIVEIMFRSGGLMQFHVEGKALSDFVDNDPQLYKVINEFPIKPPIEKVEHE
jgi:hypothetical protein